VDTVIQDAVQLQRQVGTVVKLSGLKTVVVTVTRQIRHPVYLKVIRQVTRLKVHDEHAQCRAGDLVQVEAGRPLSRTKRWRVIRVIRKAAAAGMEGAGT
jgi:small subunit ribosomal protein S17